MQQMRAPLTAFTMRSGSVRLSHQESGLSRGLDLGEQVLVHDPATHRFMTATVADVDFELEDTSYRLRLGSEVPASQAAQWQAAEERAGRLSTDDVAALLDILRSGGLGGALAPTSARRTLGAAH